MTKQTENLNLSLFDFATDTLEEFVEGVASPNNSNMQKIDEAIAERIKLNGESVQNLDFVINDDSVITSIKIKDNNNIDKELILPSRTDHVRTPIGISTEDRYTKLLKTMSGEFTSNGEDIVVDNGIAKQKVISTKMEGQTVKNYAVDVSSVLQSSTTLSKGVEWRTQGLVGGNKYDVILNISKNTHKANLYVNNKANVKSAFVEYFAIEAGGTGTFKATLTAREGVGIDFHNMCGVIMKHEEVGEIVIDNLIILDANNSEDSINGFLDFGLNSTKVTISNNGNKTPIYESIVKGNTKILKALKGTNEWVKVDVGEERDRDVYDYKLESENGLGSTLDTFDYIDLSRKVKICHTKEVVLDGSSTWFQPANTLTDTIEFWATGDYGGYNKLATISCFSDNMKNTCAQRQSKTDEESISVYLVPRIRIKKSKLEKLNTIGIAEYLAKNPITVRYRLAKPVEVPLTDEELIHYSETRKIIKLNKLGAVADTLEILEDGSGVYTQNIKIVNLKIFNGQWNMRPLKENTIHFYIPILEDLNTGKYALTIFDKIGKAVYDTDTVGGYTAINRNLQIQVLKTDLETLDAVGFEAYLEKENIMMAYCCTPITTKIPKELMPTIATHKTNNFSFGDEVKPSKAIINIPIDKVSTLESEIEQLEKVMSSISNLSLMANYVEDEYNKEIDQL